MITFINTDFTVLSLTIGTNGTIEIPPASSVAVTLRAGTEVTTPDATVHTVLDGGILSFSATNSVECLGTRQDDLIRDFNGGFVSGVGLGAILFVYYAVRWAMRIINTGDSWED